MYYRDTKELTYSRFSYNFLTSLYSHGISILNLDHNSLWSRERCCLYCTVGCSCKPQGCSLISSMNETIHSTGTYSTKKCFQKQTTKARSDVRWSAPQHTHPSEGYSSNGTANIHVAPCNRVGREGGTVHCTARLCMKSKGYRGIGWYLCAFACVCLSWAE